MNVPPSFTRKTSYVGVGRREIIIMVVSILIGGFLAIALPFPEELIYIRVGIAAALIFAGLYLAISRDPKSQRTPEQMLLSYLGYWLSPKHFRRGFEPAPAAPRRPSGLDALNSMFVGHEGKSAAEIRDDEIAIPAISMGYQSFLSLMALAGFCLFVGWMYFGGAQAVRSMVEQLVPFSGDWVSLFYK